MRPYQISMHLKVSTSYTAISGKYICYRFSGLHTSSVDRLLHSLQKSTFFKISKPFLACQVGRLEQRYLCSIVRVVPIEMCVIHFTKFFQGVGFWKVIHAFT